MMVLSARSWRSGPLWGLAGLLLGILIHLVAILAIPTLAPDTGQMRLAALLGRRTGFQLIPADAEPPGHDPMLRQAVCRYDVATEPVRIVVQAGPALVSLVVLPETGPPVFALSGDAARNGRLDVMLDAHASDASSPDAAGMVRLRPPQPRGFVILKVLDQPGDAVTRLVAGARCGPAQGL